MRFTQFLIETHQITAILNEKYDLVLQKIVDAVDNGHVDYSAGKISFNIGELTDTPKLRGLKLVIRPGETENIRLGRDKDGKSVIVIDITEALPERKEIDTFLASKKVYRFEKAYEEYVKNHHDHNAEYEDNATQSNLKYNERDTFEDSYNTLIDGIQGHARSYTQATGEIDKELGKVANVGRKTALDLAKNKLRDDYFGQDEKQFISKVLALPEADFVKHLNKDWKSKLEARLASYYKSNYSQ